jgi:hypothetical protein
MAFVLTNARDRPLLAAVALFLLAAGTSPSLAQTTPKPPSGTGGGAGVGGGAGNIDTVPDFSPVPMTPAAPAAPSTVAPQPVAPAPAPIIRFRCQVPAGASTCKEQPAPDGGGDSDVCDCARDLCYNDGAGTRICEKP